MKEIYMPVGQTASVEGNTISTVDPRSRFDAVEPSSKSIHETIHGVLDGDPQLMTIIPGKDYEGLTIPKNNPSAKAAIGPYVMGHKGTGHDLMVAAASGENLQAAAKEAKSEVERKKHRIEHVARALETHGTIFNDQYNKLVREADDRKADKDNGVTPIVIWDRSGNKLSLKAPVVNNKVKIPAHHLRVAS
jgi:hypothetical protein